MVYRIFLKLQSTSHPISLFPFHNSNIPTQVYYSTASPSEAHALNPTTKIKILAPKNNTRNKVLKNSKNRTSFPSPDNARIINDRGSVIKRKKGTILLGHSRVHQLTQKLFSSRSRNHSAFRSLSVSGRKPFSTDTSAYKQTGRSPGRQRLAECNGRTSVCRKGE